MSIMEYSNTVEGTGAGTGSELWFRLGVGGFIEEVRQSLSAHFEECASSRRSHRGVKAFGAWCSLPRVLLQTMLHKEPKASFGLHKSERCPEAHCHKVPLADYGDMPHIFRMEDAHFKSRADPGRFNAPQEKLSEELAAQQTPLLQRHLPHSQGPRTDRP